IAAAKQVIGVTKKKVHVVDTRSVPQGVSAVVAFRPEKPASENLSAMKAEAERVQTIEVTHAVRDTRSNGLRVKKGDVIAVVTDSTADLPDEWRDRYDIEVVPLKVIFGKETFRDRVDMTDEEFFRRLAVSNTLPTTSAPSPGEFAEVYRRLSKDHEGCISI